MVFADRFGCWGFLDLWRTGAAPPFGDQELEYLAGVAAPLTEALRGAQARTFRPRTGDAARRLGPVVLLLAPDLQVIGQTPETQSYLRRLIPPPDQAAPIPASAYNVGAQLLAVQLGADGSPPRARVHLADGVWLTLRAGWVDDDGAPEGRNIAVTIEEASPAERLDVFARAFGLSRRETELLGHLAGGRTTRELARALFISENTVQDHLKSVFAKTSCNSRAAVLSHALGA
jgi:DNA-binding CsgD family transcriptional regulator